VIAASAGNHAQGVAWGSRKLGTSALIVMPVTAPLVKIQNTKALGAEVMLAGDNYQEAYEQAQKLVRKTGRVFIPAFEHPDVIAGQGTVGLEILEQLPEVDYVVGSIGGGGMMAGVSVAIRSLKPTVKLIGCQASGAPAMAQSFASGKAGNTDRVDTFADGIAVSKASPGMLRLLKPRLDEILLADDEAMARAVLTLLEKARVLVEGSGALPIAVLDQLRKRGKEFKGKKVVAIMSGGTRDGNLLGRIIDRGLIQAGRRLRLNVWVSDRPGSLARLTALIASEGANVLQAIHDRNELSTRIDETEVALTLETKGPEHSQRVVAAIRSQVVRLELLG
jgi:threonine dehydratase